MLGPIGDALGGAFNGAVDGFFGGSSSGGVQSSGSGGAQSSSLEQGLGQVAELEQKFQEQQEIAIQSQIVQAEGNTGLSIAKAKLNT